MGYSRGMLYLKDGLYKMPHKWSNLYIYINLLISLGTHGIARYDAQTSY